MHSFKALRGKQLLVFTGDDQRIDPLMGLIQPATYEVVQVPTKNSFSEVKRCREVIGKMRSPRVVLFTCGPLGRILARDGCAMRPDSTWLDIGSAYDPLTRQVWHRCHTGELPRCRGCN